MSSPPCSPSSRRVRAAGLALAALLPALALAQLPQPVRVGFVCPFSGGSQDFGNAARLGAELAVKEINEAGGFLGRPLQLVARDDKANPDEGRKIAEEFVLQKKADFTVGYCNSGVAAKALDVYHDHQHLLMIPVATGTALTARYAPSASFVFRLSVRDSLQATAIVDEIVRRGLTRVAIFADNTGYGEGGLKDVKQRLEEKKLTPVHVARFDLGVSTLTAAMQEAKAAGANAIVSYTVGPEQAVVLQSRAEARLAAPLFGPWTLAFRSVIERAGASVVEGAVMPQTIIQDLAHERRTSFLARYRKLAGDRAPMGSLMAATQTYDAVHLMLRALFQTRGDARGPALKDALENLQHAYSGVVTTYDKPFGPTDHDAITRNMIWLGTWRGGEVHFLNADDARRAATIQRKGP